MPVVNAQIINDVLSTPTLRVNGSLSGNDIVVHNQLFIDVNEGTGEAIIHNSGEATLYISTDQLANNPAYVALGSTVRIQGAIEGGVQQGIDFIGATAITGNTNITGETNIVGDLNVQGFANFDLTQLDTVVTSPPIASDAVALLDLSDVDAPGGVYTVVFQVIRAAVPGTDIVSEITATLVVDHEGFFIVSAYMPGYLTVTGSIPDVGSLVVTNNYTETIKVRIRFIFMGGLPGFMKRPA